MQLKAQYNTENINRFAGSIECWKPIDKVIYQTINELYNNNDANTVATKLHLVGRLYMATVERRKNADETPGDFVLDYAAPAVVKANIDELLIPLSQETEITAKNIPAILKLHGLLTKALGDACGMDKRSLASKYLHFHLPKLVFLYDSRVASVVKEFVDGSMKKDRIPHIEGADKTYEEYFYKALYLYKAMKNGDCSEGVNPVRAVDNLLLRYCDNKNKGVA